MMMSTNALSQSAHGPSWIRPFIPIQNVTGCSIFCGPGFIEIHRLVNLHTHKPTIQQMGENTTSLVEVMTHIQRLKLGACGWLRHHGVMVFSVIHPHQDRKCRLPTLFFFFFIFFELSSFSPCAPLHQSFFPSFSLYFHLRASCAMLLFVLIFLPPPPHTHPRLPHLNPLTFPSLVLFSFHVLVFFT